jgi:hypothetical protein
MSLRLKIFAGACLICALARLAELHVQKQLTQTVVANNVPPQSAAPAGNFAGDNFPRPEPLPDPSESALAAGRQLLADDPSDTKGRAGNFLLSLCAVGQFQLALQFANEAPPDLKSGWLKAVFTRWAQASPQNAVNALAFIQDKSERAVLFQTIAGAWAANNPSALADYAESLPDGDDKTCALNQVVDNWSLQDPEAFSAWLNKSPSGVNLDQAIAQMISKTDEANRSSEVAMEWVECINDPALRYNSLLYVMQQWNQSNPTAAQNYLGNVSWLNDSQRAEILRNLQSPPLALSGNSDD